MSCQGNFATASTYTEQNNNVFYSVYMIIPNLKLLEILTTGNYYTIHFQGPGFKATFYQDLQGIISEFKNST